MKKLTISLLILLTTLIHLSAQSSGTIFHAQANIDCQKCHSCDIPTHKNPCLKLFPDFRREGITVKNSAEEAPELITVDTLSNIYEPTIFTHRLHAEMAEMAGGCASCHHFNPPGKVLACVDCHEPSMQRTDLSKPSLKGAYHRQCLNCHRDWSHTTNCIVCHARKGSSDVDNKSEYLGKSHDPLVVPSKLVYEVDADGPIITFYHKQHNELFGLGCAECHTNESCSRCHDTSSKEVSVEKDIHANCIDCHEQAIDDNCEKCHADNERAPFDHSNTGWALNKYHKDLRCQSCHVNNQFTELNTNCLSCHKGWKNNEFEHVVTGLQLDEDHIENDCSDCHINYNFNKKPFCNDCHDNYSFPKQKPGKLIKY